ncbi:putative glycoside hydrolase [Ammoniphilus resinae]|uniref:DUF4015 domain-containing protein n=1 Tax=Ammoniphilus resinae TaxID=861532 RepID=A0ABS4GU36_9BACL|nr:putative glycoside hydrolase [Ammoniphilus resinae]MBP1933761.1 hypothetical protein [Ammoniphilus resinae]
MIKMGRMIVPMLCTFTLLAGCSQPEPTIQSASKPEVKQDKLLAKEEYRPEKVTVQSGTEPKSSVPPKTEKVVPIVSTPAESILPERPHFDYPEAVRGIYVTAHSAGGERFARLVELIDSTDLNAMVIDIKDDYGHLTFQADGKLAPYSKPIIKDPKALLATLEKHKIYPIARVVVFKDSVYANLHPEASFVEQGHIWKNGRGEAFVNPFVKGVWQHNLEIAKEAARLGFHEVQFDYVRFPEGFEKREAALQYTMGDYKNPAPKLDNLTASTAPVPAEEKEDDRSVKARVDAVTDFVSYAKKQLEPFGVKVSVDIFGYTATLPEAPGIGQNFTKISEHVDVISSMIYPSHWGNGYFNIAKPDLKPYQLIQEYVKMEKEKMNKIENPPISRPWIQDFTATWLGKGNYIPYGKREVEAQIKALNEGGIKEFLLWNAGNSYTKNVDYTP